MVWPFTSKQKVEPLLVNSEIAVAVDQLTKIYEQDDRKVYALDDVSFEVKKGEFFSIVGRSGSGKTSMLNILGAMEKPSSGRVAINGKTLGTMSERELTLLRRLEISTIYQNYNLIPVLNAFQNVELPMLLTGMSKEERSKRAEKLLGIVGLGDRLDHIPDQLSGGENQRVAIARALANKPDIILADEPTGNLDKEIEGSILGLLEGINRDLGTTLIMVTHNPEIAERGDRILELREGKVMDLREGQGAAIRKKEQQNRIAKDPSYY